MIDYLWKALLAEFIGTFTLVFVGAGAVALTIQQGGSLIGSAFAFGLALMALIYTWGSYSGSHLNPAISFGAAIAGRMHWGLMIGYWVAQILGGIAAAALIAYFFGTESGVGASIGSLTNTDTWKAVLLEAFLTFFLVITFLMVTGNPWLAMASGLAIGLVLTFDMLVGAPLTGASMNPARSLGPALFSGNMGTYWIYVVGPLLGALVAGLIYRLFATNFRCKTKKDECGNVIKDDCGNVLKECKTPMVDNCGRTVKDCHGKTVYEVTTIHERKLNHMQETVPKALGEWLSVHGVDPRYLNQEFGKIVEKALPNGSLPDTKSMVETVVSQAQEKASALGANMPIKPPSPSNAALYSSVGQRPPSPSFASLTQNQQANLMYQPQQVQGMFPQTQGMQSAFSVPKGYASSVQSLGNTLGSGVLPMPLMQ